MHYGLKPKYLGALVFASVYDLWAGYRHSSNHILRDIGQGFGPTIFGVHTYVWVMLVFIVVLLFASVLLVLQGDKLSEKADKHRWTALNSVSLPAEIKGLVTGVSYSSVRDMHTVVISNNGVYFLSGDLKTVLASVLLDGAFSVEFSNLTAVVFDGDSSVLITTDHKSFVRLAYDEIAKVEDSYWLFMEGADGVRELKRSRFSTVRAKYNYIASLGWDEKKQEYLTITLPVKVRNNFVVSRLSGEDYELNSEAKIGNTSGDYPMIIGLVLAEDKAYLLNHTSHQILVMVMVMASNNLESAMAFSGIENPQGLTLVNGQYAILSGIEGNNRLTFLK
ncbi:hypothetical protein Sps_02815 [Shewanella psychrophila]|uniref:Uncharacterized protein n=1 Tax=Shewanella psychrophila TaxID=225848 RepID=A0A1S6HQY9_9GAMM|nr:hypothetical protein [Shewanella psychrophila]AQS37967.1 hypothetical protein Sps_02815 [Shewanella psychrophila]